MRALRIICKRTCCQLARVRRDRVRKLRRFAKLGSAEAGAEVTTAEGGQRKPRLAERQWRTAQKRTTGAFLYNP